MAESTLSYGYAQLFWEVGNFLGYGRTAATYSDAEVAECDFIVQSGYRQFLFPPPLAGEREAHVWSFLSPVTTLDTGIGDVDYDLPDDFGGLIGDRLTIVSTTRRWPVMVRGEGQVRALLRATTNTTGKPQYVAVRPKAPTGTTGQRFELIVYPEPDAIYTLEYRRNILTIKLSTTYPYPLGGMAHAETLLESCLKVAELRGDDEAGVHTAAFAERLAASVSADRQAFAPPTLGYNGDASDAQAVSLGSSHSATYEGDTYGPYGSA